MEEMKKKEDRLEKQMSEIKSENKNLVEPLQRAKEQLEELTRQLANYDKDKQSLAVRQSLNFNANCEVYRDSLSQRSGIVCLKDQGLFVSEIRDSLSPQSHV